MVSSTYLDEKLFRFFNGLIQGHVVQLPTRLLGSYAEERKAVTVFMVSSVPTDRSSRTIDRVLATRSA